ncbi:putative Uridine-cytidine kinase protein, partial [Naja naja]
MASADGVVEEAVPAARHSSAEAAPCVVCFVGRGGIVFPDVSVSLRLSGSRGAALNSLGRLPLTPSLSPRKRTTSQSKTEPPLLRTSKRTIYTAGRPPWYNETGTPFKEAFVIGRGIGGCSFCPIDGGRLVLVVFSSFPGLCGGSASGKTTVANKIIEALDVPWVVLLSMDSFYK